MDNQNSSSSSISDETSSDGDGEEVSDNSSLATSSPLLSPDANGLELFGSDYTATNTTDTSSDVDDDDDSEASAEEEEAADDNDNYDEDGEAILPSPHQPESEESDMELGEAGEEEMVNAYQYYHHLHQESSEGEAEVEVEQRLEETMDYATRSLLEGIKQMDPATRHWWNAHVRNGNVTDVTDKHDDDDEASSYPNPNVREKVELLNLLEKLLEEEKGMELEGSDKKDALFEMQSNISIKEKKIHELKRQITELEQQKQQHGKKNELPVIVIASNNSCDGNDNGGRRDAQFILPEELWKIIIESIKDPEDQRSCSETCQLFLKFLIPRRYLWGFDKAFQYFYRYLDDNSILACRVVCKGWCFGVDHFFSHHRTLRPHSAENFDPRYSPSVLVPLQHTKVGGYEFSDNQHYLYFGRTNLIYNAELRDHPRNPFISRFLRITELDIYDKSCATFFRCPEAFWSAVYRFLARRGKHIWYLSFATNVKERDLEIHTFFNNFFLKYLFLLVPNLKLLRISGHLCKYFLGYSYERKEEIPKAPFLETLQIDDVTYDRPHPVLEALLKRFHKQLKRLHIKYDLWKNVSHLDWNLIVEIHVEEIETSEELSSLKNLKDSCPILQKLGISLSTYHKDSLKILLEVLNILGENTRLNVFRFSGGGFPKTCLSNLPPSLYVPYCLKTLEFELKITDDFVLTSDFLMRFPFLQTLNVFLKRDFGIGNKFPISPSRNLLYLMERYHSGYYRKLPESFTRILRRKDKELMQLYDDLLGYTGEVYLSDVWDYLPCLKTITFQGNIYSRDEFEKHMKIVDEEEQQDSSDDDDEEVQK